ncbi:MAG: DUF4091 domain-containing protein [Verrucomicrobia bacterium]|nr:DUF4091 domain-containing protein [Verrucomicrobiota bacterium]
MMRSHFLAFLLWMPANALFGAERPDSFHPLQALIEIDAPAAGDYLVDLTPQLITDWLNQVSDFKFKAEYFDYDSVKLDEVDDHGAVIAPNVVAGYRLVVGPELVQNSGFEEQEDGKPVAWRVTHEAFKLQKTSHDGSWCMTVDAGSDRNHCAQSVPTDINTWYRYSHWIKGLDVTAGPYIFNKRVGNRISPRRTYYDPYQPAEGWCQQEFFFHTGDKSDWEEGKDEMRVAMERFVGALDDVSLRECQVGFVLKADRPGRRLYRIGYAPSEGVTPSAPAARAEALPSRRLAVKRIGEPRWVDDGIVYSLHASDAADLWYAASVRKVLERTPPPAAQRKKITLWCGRNESEAFQVVFRPRKDGALKAVRISLSNRNKHTLGPEQFDIRRACYVTIHQPSLTGADGKEPSRSEFTGRLPDPLPPFAPVNYKAGDPNILIWVDVAVPKTASAGVYTGDLILATTSGEIRVPVELNVWDITLPDRMTCRSSLQCAQYDNEHLFPFHQVETSEDKAAVTRTYITQMARCRLNPENPLLGGAWDSTIRAQGGPAEQQIALWEREFPWGWDELKLNSFRIEKVAGPGMIKETPESARTVAAFYEPLAAHLAKAGWLKHCFMAIDEPRPEGASGLRAWIGAFRKLPHAKDIKMLAAFYNYPMYPLLRDDLDIFVPVNNDSDSCVSPKAIAQLPPGKEVWFYWTNSSHQWIDAPGLNHRLWAPKTWAFGGQGLFVWSILQWWTLPQAAELQLDNPWKNPFTPWGNGALCYFYPPNPLGKDLTERDLRVVPSLRLALVRDGIEDMEYAVILKRLIHEVRAMGRDTGQAEAALAMFHRQFKNPVNWKLGETYWEDVRSAVAENIVRLQKVSGKP